MKNINEYVPMGGTTEAPLITILGPTACGKTSVAVELARHINGEIISADSRQVYKRMDLGTGKDLDEYEGVPYHLIDIWEPGTKYNLFQYQEDFHKALADIRSRNKWPILCGGTGLYIESVLKGYQLSPVPQNPELRASLADKSLDELTLILKELKQQTGSNMHNQTDVDTAQRAIRAIEIEQYNLQNPLPRRSQPQVDSIIIGLDIDRDERRRKITQRLYKRLEDGMLQEVQSLLDGGIPADDLIYYGLEYKFLTEHLIGKLTLEEMIRQLEIAIHQFSKRQMTWFRGMERRGFSIHWINTNDTMNNKIDTILQFLLK